MVMEMLEAGGLRVWYDVGAHPNDDRHPRGRFEMIDPSTLDFSLDGVVKLAGPVLFALALTQCDVIVIERASERVARYLGSLEEVEQQRVKLNRLLTDHRGRIMRIAYEDICANPLRYAIAIGKWLCHDFDFFCAAGVVRRIRA